MHLSCREGVGEIAALPKELQRKELRNPHARKTALCVVPSSFTKPMCFKARSLRKRKMCRHLESYSPYRWSSPFWW